MNEQDRERHARLVEDNHSLRKRVTELERSLAKAVKANNANDAIHIKAAERIAALERELAETRAEIVAREDVQRRLVEERDAAEANTQPAEQRGEPVGWVEMGELFDNCHPTITGAGFEMLKALKQRRVPLYAGASKQPAEQRGEPVGWLEEWPGDSMAHLIADGCDEERVREQMTDDATLRVLYAGPLADAATAKARELLSDGWLPRASARRVEMSQIDDTGCMWHVNVSREVYDAAVRLQAIEDTKRASKKPGAVGGGHDPGDEDDGPLSPHMESLGLELALGTDWSSDTVTVQLHDSRDPGLEPQAAEPCAICNRAMYAGDLRACSGQDDPGGPCVAVSVAKARGWA